MKGKRCPTGSKDSKSEVWSRLEHRRGASEPRRARTNNGNRVDRADLRAEATFEQRDEGEGAELHKHVGSQAGRCTRMNKPSTQVNTRREAV